MPKNYERTQELDKKVKEEVEELSVEEKNQLILHLVDVLYYDGNIDGLNLDKEWKVDTIEVVAQGLKEKIEILNYGV